jgi:transforming growth factor-beta-induced protein
MKKFGTLLKLRNTFVVLLIAISVLAVSCDKTENGQDMSNPQEGLQDIAATLESLSANPELLMENSTEPESTAKRSGSYKRPPTFFNLTAALIKTNLLSTVAKNQLTIFAPTDEAFSNLFKALGVKGLRDLTAEQLKPILLYHVVNGKVYSNQLKNGFVPTLNGSAVEVKLNGGVMINDAKVVYANIWALNGVIHVIDKVLLPPTKNLVDLATSFAPEFSILVDAVVAAGLAETLATGGPFTVFAPTNDAFVKLLSELGFSSLDQLVNAIGLDGLKSVLLYHVVGGRVYSSDLPAGPLTVTTLSGGNFVIDASKLNITDFKNRQANLVSSLLNIQGTNGVIHVIDRVILPKLGK